MRRKKGKKTENRKGLWHSYSGNGRTDKKRKSQMAIKKRAYTKK